jgi:hypothetical protein
MKQLMKKKLIALLEYLLSLLDPGLELPLKRLNHRKAIDAIVSQSGNSRRAFLSMLADVLWPEEVEMIINRAKHSKPYGDRENKGISSRAGQSTSVSKKNQKGD